MATSHPRQPVPQRRYSDETYSTWLDEAEKGLADVLAGRTSDARTSIAAIQARRLESQIRDALRRELTKTS